MLPKNKHHSKKKKKKKVVIGYRNIGKSFKKKVKQGLAKEKEFQSKIVLI